MKRIVFIVAMAIATMAAAQTEKLKVETFYLSNGLKVILAEEHSQPKIFGAMLVHAGSKNEEPDATGVAHYFEHIMFKGTDQIGTTDWDREKPYLDSISAAYDRLHATQDESARHEIQLEINRLNIEASKYAIPNEVDVILQQMGCTGLNAGTGYDQTVYYNTLPSNQLENWMKVYAERFRRPIFRLFQSELEAVYEERNMYSNDQMYTFTRNLFTEGFGEHPYSRDIIGLDEHLKNPQPSAMEAFFQKYYVAGNMCLILAGDLDIATAKPLAEKYFSSIKKGERAKPVTAAMPKFDRQVVKEVKQTPIKAGIIIFPGVKQSDPDAIPLSVLSSILSSGNNGLDALATNGKILMAQLLPFSMEDAGSNNIIYVPKMIGQKHADAEEYIWAALDSIKQGQFSEKQLETVKMSLINSHKREMEDYSSIASMLLEIEQSGITLEEYDALLDRVKNITKEDIMALANKYFDRDHCTIIRSSMGFPDKGSSIKPDWEHLEGLNKGVQSGFAKDIASQQVEEIEPQEILFDKDVEIFPLTKSCQMYASQNPKNDLCELNIIYHYGTYDNPALSVAEQYFNALGCDSLTPQDYELEMGCLGGEFRLSVGRDWSTISLSGPEGNMEAIIDLALRKLRNPRHDAQQITNIVDGLKASKQSAKNDAVTWFSALNSYILYGEKSEYINRPTIKQVKKMTGEELVEQLQAIFSRHGHVTYVGNADTRHLGNLLTANGLVRDDAEVIAERELPRRRFDENEVFYCTNKKFLQSNILVEMHNGDFDLNDRAACLCFNEYFGGGMNSIVFQEIREFRSLGYSTTGSFSYHEKNLRPAYLYTFLGTQCDKTIDGIEALRSLMVEFPDREDKFIPARDFLVQARNSNYFSFRGIPANVRGWIEYQGYDHDPRKELTEQVKNLQYDDLRVFHDKYVKGRPVVVIFSGNDKKFDTKALSKYGKVNKISAKQIMKF